MIHETVQYRRFWYAVILVKVNYVKENARTSVFKGMAYVKPRSELKYCRNEVVVRKCRFCYA